MKLTKLILFLTCIMLAFSGCEPETITPEDEKTEQPDQTPGTGEEGDKEPGDGTEGGGTEGGGTE